MSQTVEMHIIARIHSDFPTKFGIPRQSGLADVPARIVFEPEYRNAMRCAASRVSLTCGSPGSFRRGARRLVADRAPPKLGGN